MAKVDQTEETYELSKTEETYKPAKTEETYKPAKTDDKVKEIALEEFPVIEEVYFKDIQDLVSDIRSTNIEAGTQSVKYVLCQHIEKLLELYLEDFELRSGSLTEVIKFVIQINESIPKTPGVKKFEDVYVIWINEYIESVKKNLQDSRGKLISINNVLLLEDSYQIHQVDDVFNTDDFRFMKHFYKIMSAKMSVPMSSVYEEFLFITYKCFFVGAARYIISK